MDNINIGKAFNILRRMVSAWQEPIVGRIAREHEPYKVLISTILSLRTKDSTTDAASRKLFLIADRPDKMIKLSIAEIEKAIFPVGFYHTKAKNIIEASGIITDRYHGKVPDTLDELLKLPGVGRKTANLVLILGFDKMGICVDTHVHRITNRWGYVKTKNPDETEMALREKLPRKYWKEINNLLVPYGQNLCMPVSPFCSKCRIASFCEKISVSRSR
ncbi:MAG TPA: endonuclease III [Desulfomonilia bacterium]